MKILKQNSNNQKPGKIDRSLIARLGNILYRYNDVKNVSIRVKFKDGSSVEFEKDENDDELEAFLDGESE